MGREIIILQTARIYSHSIRKASGWRSAVGSYCKFSRCAVYIESRTRDNRRTDVIVDYRGRQYIIEIKIWRGNEYNQRGEKQIADYLDAYGARKGYLLSFNFNKSKEPGIREMLCDGKVILEVVV